MTFELHHGDCLEVLRGMADNSVDSIVTDPPYGLMFMGKKWDCDVPATDVWVECLRVLKPGGHLLAFAGTRTQHRMAVRIEDAGFEIRDMIAWVYGSGFPKSLNVSKAIDGKLATGRSDSIALREVNETRPGEATVRATSTNGHRGIVGSADAGPSVKRDEPATDAAREWQGWGTALKPALEPITVARKPLVGTVADTVLEFGTGALSIDACRVPHGDELRAGAGGIPCRHDETTPRGRSGQESAGQRYTDASGTNFAALPGPRGGAPEGRWPANLIHDGHADVVALFPSDAGAAAPVRGTEASAASVGEITNQRARVPGAFHSDSGSAARFFYCAKADKSDRDAGLESFTPRSDPAHRKTNLETADNAYLRGVTERRNTHPTVKPTDLMRYLCRLVTPPGGTVLDPYNGSGSTGKAAVLEGFRYIGIEREAEHIATSRARIDHAVLLAKAGAEVLKPASDRDAHTADLFSEAA